MQRRLRSRSVKKTRLVTPGGRTVLRFKTERANYAHCGNCGAKLNRAKLNTRDSRKLTKVQRRAERPLPELCPSCMRSQMKSMVRSNANAG